AVRPPDPALDPRVEPFDARPVTIDRVAFAIVRGVLRVVDDLPDPRIALPDQDGHEVLAARKDEDVALLAIQVARQPLLGLAPDRREADVPAQAERPVAQSRGVGQRELRAEARAAGAQRDRDGHRPRAGDRVRLEFFADSLEGASTLGERDLWNLDGSAECFVLLRLLHDMGVSWTIRCGARDAFSARFSRRRAPRLLQLPVIASSRPSSSSASTRRWSASSLTMQPSVSRTSAASRCDACSAASARAQSSVSAMPGDLDRFMRRSDWRKPVICAANRSSSPSTFLRTMRTSFSK